MNRRRFLISGLVVGSLVLCWPLFRAIRSGGGMRDQLLGFGADLERSGESFPMGDLRVIVEYGYSDGGDRLRYMVIRAYPATATPEEMHADTRFDIYSDVPPLVRHPDGTMRRVESDGRVYLFIGDELRTMRVEMNEHTDTVGLSQAGSLEGMWDYLQRFHVAGAD